MPADIHFVVGTNHCLQLLKKRNSWLAYFLQIFTRLNRWGLFRLQPGDLRQNKQFGGKWFIVFLCLILLCKKNNTKKTTQFAYTSNSTKFLNSCMWNMVDFTNWAKWLKDQTKERFCRWLTVVQLKPVLAKTWTLEEEFWRVPSSLT